MPSNCVLLCWTREQWRASNRLSSSSSSSCFFFSSFCDNCSTINYTFFFFVNCTRSDNYNPFIAKYASCFRFLVLLRSCDVKWKKRKTVWLMRFLAGASTPAAASSSSSKKGFPLSAIIVIAVVAVLLVGAIAVGVLLYFLVHRPNVRNDSYQLALH